MTTHDIHVIFGTGLLGRWTARLREIEAEGGPARYDNVVKSVEPVRLLSTRQIVPAIGDMAWLCDDVHTRLRAWLRLAGIRAIEAPAPHMVNVHHNTEYSETDLDLEAGVPVPNSGALSARAKTEAPFPISVRELEPSPLTACGVHLGAMAGLPDLIKSVLLWVGSNGFAPAGPLRELHLAGRAGDEPAKRVMEIQLPVRREP